MTYGQGNYQSRSNYGQQGGSGGYQNKGGYSAPPKKQYDLYAECAKYAEIYLALTSALEANNVKLEDVSGYIGGWVSGIKITGDKLGA